MYVLVRRDLTPGLQAAQVVHAAIALALNQPDRVSEISNVVVLSVADENELRSFSVGDGVLFYEPDVDGHTAYAQVSDGIRYSSLPLAGAAMA